MLKMVADESGSGRVYGIDIQIDALKNTSSLLDATVTQKEVLLVVFYMPSPLSKSFQEIVKF